MVAIFNFNFAFDLKKHIVTLNDRSQQLPFSRGPNFDLDHCTVFSFLSFYLPWHLPWLDVIALVLNDSFIQCFQSESLLTLWMVQSIDSIRKLYASLRLSSWLLTRFWPWRYYGDPYDAAAPSCRLPRWPSPHPSQRGWPAASGTRVDSY